MINMADIGISLLSKPPKETNVLIAKLKSQGLMFEQYIQKCIIPLLQRMK